MLTNVPSVRRNTMSTEPPTLQTPIEILQAALKKEKDAYHFYDALFNSTTVFFLQELLEQLRDEEHKHVVLIEKKIAKLLSDS
jgi:rubrerythrin